MYSLQSGYNSFATAPVSYAEGVNNIASGWFSHAEGIQNVASGSFSHVEGGYNNTASGNGAHAEGSNTTASGINAHAEGVFTIAAGMQSHAEGYSTIATGENSLVIGKFNVGDTSDNWNEWVAGTSYNYGDKVKYLDHLYRCIEANNNNNFNYNQWQSFRGMNYAFIVGNGTNSGTSARSNAYVVDWNGNGHYRGDVYVHAEKNSTGGVKLATINDIVLQDVQVNGVSVVANGVANVPIASSSEYGTVKINISDGVGFTSDGTLTVKRAISTNSVKAGDDGYMFVPTYAQHMSAFYGLAKAAGADMAQSSNAVGQYTDAAKTAIKNMIGVEEGLKVVRLI